MRLLNCVTRVALVWCLPAGWGCAQVEDVAGSAPGDAGGEGRDGTGADDGVFCDEQLFAIDRRPVRLMILQDVSFSMSEGTPTKWSQAVPAMRTMLNDWADRDIEFGFDIFPDSNAVGRGCHVSDPVQIDAAPATAASIIAFLNDYTPWGESTPLWCGMNNFNRPGYAPRFVAEGAQPYLLVVSDGEDLCSPGCVVGGGSAGPGELAMVTMQLLSNGIKTFVIGFGNEARPADLNAIAGSGGTPFDTYFDARSEEELREALETIAGSVMSCLWDIEEPDATADPDVVNFYLDGVPVPYDEGCAAATGWRWTDDTHLQVEFCGAACHDLVWGTVTEVSARFGCPTVLL